MEVKRENHFINNNDFQITPSAIAVHGITSDYLLQHGEDRMHVLSALIRDLEYYQPLVIGHFMEFDALVLGAELYRTSLPNPLTSLPQYCTMVGTKNYVRNPLLKYLHLGDLYFILFQKNLQKQHDALADAQATAQCFFELKRIGDLDEAKIEEQQQVRKKAESRSKKLGFNLLAIVTFLVILSLYFWL